jgi:formylglycine-generating enzyme required for sulfatase activity/predicted Ser/Thr protein kinase
MPLSPGKILHNGRYRIDQLLSKGGYGEVYKAWDQTLEGFCAVKRNLNLNPEVHCQFQQEAKLLFQLHHANLPKVYDYFDENQDQYLVMYFIEGENLDTIVKRSGALPIEQALDWVCQVGEALIYLHNRQPPIIHRDIKPANIILTPEGEVVLVDFGIAKSGDIQQQTVSGAHGFTSGFSPPEQYGTTGTDAQSDVYALAATTYLLLTGQTPADAWAIVVGEKPAMLPARQLNPTVPDSVSRVVEAAMQMNRIDRTETVEDFLTGLHAALQNQTTKLFPPDQPDPTSVIEQQEITQIHDPQYNLIPHLRKENFIEPELVCIPAGEFLMGSDGDVDPHAGQMELPQHKLHLPKFWIGKYPVTNEEYRLFLFANPERSKPCDWRGINFPPGKEHHPVIGITWHDAMAYCRWLDKMTSKVYSLPSEAEWEKAARGTDGRIYPWGNTWHEESCIFRENGFITTTPVGKFSPSGDSPYGVTDMVGYVWEWTRSHWLPYPYPQGDAGKRKREELITKDNIYRVLRGGYFPILPWGARCAFRLKYFPSGRHNSFGFRLVISPIFAPHHKR